MSLYRGKARNALARTLEPPPTRRGFEVRPWGILAWLLLGLLAALLTAWRFR